MPKRKETTRSKRLNEQVLNSLREIVLSGTPWTKAGFDGIAGDSDVYGLISGHFFFPKYCSLTMKSRSEYCGMNLKKTSSASTLSIRLARVLPDGGDGNGQSCAVWWVAIA